MISLKRKSKGAPVQATGLRRPSSVYVPNQAEPFKISRTRLRMTDRLPLGEYDDRSKRHGI